MQSNTSLETSPTNKAKKTKKTGFIKSPLETIRRLRSSSNKNTDNLDETSPKQLNFTEQNEDSTENTSEICIAKCGIRNSDDLIQCKCCLHQAHASCLNEESDIWICSKCRNVSENISELLNDMKYVCRELHNVKISSIEANTRFSQLENKLEENSHELASLRRTNSELVQQLEDNNRLVATLNTENALLKEELKKKQAGNAHGASVNKPSLLIGDSLVRDIHSDDQSKLMIRTLPGAKLNAVKNKLALFARDNSRFSQIVIVAGTNDCSQIQSSTDTILEDTKEVLECAVKIANSVTFSSILPRIDNGSALLKIETVNQRINEICSRIPNVKYLDNDKSFRLVDKSPNEGYFLPDGLHLNMQGTERLITNLGIRAIYRKRYQSRLNYPKQSYTQSRPTSRSVGQQNFPQVLQNDMRANYNNRDHYQWHYFQNQLQPQAYHALPSYFSASVPQTTSNNVFQQQQLQNNPFQLQQQPRYTADAQPPPMPQHFGQPMTCNRCGRNNHPVSMCPVDPSIICFSCGLRGHTSQTCVRNAYPRS